MQHKEDIEVKTPEADGEAAPVDWKLARSLVEPLYLDQKLYTGEPRLAHADGMAEILKGVRNDDELIVAAYLFSVTDCIDRKSTRLNSSHKTESRMPSSA